MAGRLARVRAGGQRPVAGLAAAPHVAHQLLQSHVALTDAEQTDIGLLISSTAIVIVNRQV